MMWLMMMWPMMMTMMRRVTTTTTTSSSLHQLQPLHLHQPVQSVQPEQPVQTVCIVRPCLIPCNSEGQGATVPQPFFGLPVSYLPQVRQQSPEANARSVRPRLLPLQELTSSARQQQREERAARYEERNHQLDYIR